MDTCMAGQKAQRLKLPVHYSVSKNVVGSAGYLPFKTAVVSQPRQLRELCITLCQRSIYMLEILLPYSSLFLLSPAVAGSAASVMLEVSSCCSSRKSSFNTSRRS